MMMAAERKVSPQHLLILVKLSRSIKQLLWLQVRCRA